MGNFIAKAFVKITDCNKRTEVINHLWDAGLKQVGVALNVAKDCIQINQGLYQCKDNYCIVKDCATSAIDCNHYANGDEDLAIKLFLTLAQMRDGTTYPKYVKFTQDVYRYPDGGEYGVLEYCENEVCEWQDLFNCEPICYYWIDASPLDVAEAVMRGDVKL